MKKILAYILISSILLIFISLSNKQHSQSVKIKNRYDLVDSASSSLWVNKKVFIIMPNVRYLVRIFIVIPKDTNLSPLRLIYIEKLYKRGERIIEEKELIIIPYKGHSQRTRDGPIKFAFNNVPHFLKSI